MKLQTENRTVERGGVVTESEFKIKATAKAFGILSSGLYSDKPLAIVRELSCNAYDAHVAAGKAKVPFIIKLPTTLDPTFYVKDFGIGLDHKGVTELYTTYFESTKADSNDFIGALGLGSKSPFSYVSTFSVEARKDGTKRFYSAFINENGVPAITKLGEEETDEENGLTVSFSAKRGDEDKFRTAAMKALMYFDPCPTVKGGGPNFAPYELKHTVKGKSWRLRSTSYYASMRGAFVVQGFVAYPIDREQLMQSNDLEQGVADLLEMDIDVYVPLGDVDIAASREALQYNPHTVRNLCKAARLAADEMRVSIQAEFDKCKNKWEVAQKVGQFTSTHDDKMFHLFRRLHGIQEFTWQGKPVSNTIKVSLGRVKQTEILVVKKWGRKASSSAKWEPASATKSVDLAFTKGMAVYVDDLHSTNIVGQYLDENKSGVDAALVLRGITKKMFSRAEVDLILQQLECGNEYVVASTLPYKKVKTTASYKPKQRNEVFTWEGFPTNGGYRKNQIRRSFSRLCWGRETIDFNKDGGYYVEVDRFTIIHGKKEQQYFDLFLKRAITFGILPDKVTVYGLNEKQLKAIKGNKKWVDVFSHVAQEMKKLNANNEITDRIVYEDLVREIGLGVKEHIIDNWSALQKKIVGGDFKNVISKIVAVKNNGVNRQVDTCREAVAYIPDWGVSANDIVTRRDALLKDFRSVMSKHGMLAFVDWSNTRGGAKIVDTIVDYVNMLAKV